MLKSILAIIPIVFHVGMNNLISISGLGIMKLSICSLECHLKLGSWNLRLVDTMLGNAQKKE